MAKYENIPSPEGDYRYFECLSWERQQVEFCGAWIYREFQEREDNPEYSFYCAAGYWATETLEEMKAQINKSYDHKRSQINKESDQRLEIAREESKIISKISWAHTVFTLAGGLAGFSIAGPIGLVAGLLIGSATIIF